MDNGVLLETKTLVKLLCHSIRDQMRVFSVIRSCCCCCFENINGLWPVGYIKRYIIKHSSYNHALVSLYIEVI